MTTFPCIIKHQAYLISKERVKMKMGTNYLAILGVTTMTTVMSCSSAKKEYMTTFPCIIKHQAYLISRRRPKRKPGSPRSILHFDKIKFIGAIKHYTSKERVKMKMGTNYLAILGVTTMTTVMSCSKA